MRCRSGRGLEPSFPRLDGIAAHLIPKRVTRVTIVQLNGSGNTYTPDNQYAANILQKFSENYQASFMFFPVPTFFDYKETKDALWRERSIQKIIEMQQHADILLYSIAAVNTNVSSHVYSRGYLDPTDLKVPEGERVIGDLATAFSPGGRELRGYSANLAGKRSSLVALDGRAPRHMRGVRSAAGLHERTHHRRTDGRPFMSGDGHQSC